MINELTEMKSDTIQSKLTENDLSINKLNVIDRFRSLFSESFIDSLIDQIFQNFKDIKCELFKTLMRFSYVSYDHVFEIIYSKFNLGLTNII